jgi:hypothetical protein
MAMGSDGRREMLWVRVLEPKRRQSSSLGALTIASVHFRETKETSRVAGSERQPFYLLFSLYEHSFGLSRATRWHILHSFLLLLLQLLPLLQRPNPVLLATTAVPRPRTRATESSVPFGSQRSTGNRLQRQILHTRCETLDQARRHLER